ncbi:hypothetical protein ACFYUY_11510 [Kitasatospora sp. NPDC004745]|uniref:hypothetical protein n=1 Tax=unclassified Kitasatospora TaxID=2633591 RepID=UPI0033EF3237
MARSSIGERYVVSIGCRVAVERGPATTTVRWSVSHLPPGGSPRPAAGRRDVGLICPRCTQAFSVRVESAGRARGKQLVQRVLGWLLVLSLLVTLPMLVHLGGQTVEEGDDRAVDTIGVLVALAAAGVVVGPSLLATAKLHSGVGRLRRIREGGGRTVRVRGHRLF